MGERQQATIMMGNQASVEGALKAGCTFFAGYPITPSSEIMELLSGRLPRAGGAFIQMEDELASFSAVVGAAWSGAKAMTATSGPGLSLMMEGIGYAAITETPCVLVDIQRAGPATGQATRVGSGDLMQVRFGSHGDICPIALSPWSAQEMYDLTIRAFNLAERYRVPTFVLSEESVGHLRETVVMHDDFELVERDRRADKPPFGHEQPDGVPPMPVFGDGANLMVTGSTHDEWGYRKVDSAEQHTTLIGRINRKILDHAAEIAEVDERYMDDARIAIVTYGFTARSALAAVRRLRKAGVKAGLLRLKTIWPFPEERVAALDGRVDWILVPEMNMGQLGRLVRECVCCEVVGLNQVNGEVIAPHSIVKAIEKRLK